MKIAVITVLLLMPCFSFGQLFPKVPEFRGNIKKVVEKWYGKEYNPWRKDSGSYKPGVFSGLKYTYLFDENSQLTKRIITFKGQINNECLYLTKTEGNRKIVQEKMKDYLTDKKEYLLEYENFLDQDGKIRKVNFWEQVSPESPKELFLFEMNAEYNKNKLTEFTRYNISTTGDTTSGEKCILTYDTRGRLKQIDRKDVSSGFTNSIHYYYNGKGLIERSSIDLMAEMQEYGKKQSQDIYYKYDKHKNWTRMYRKLGKKIIPEAKRTIRYQ